MIVVKVISMLLQFQNLQKVHSIIYDFRAAITFSIRNKEK